MGGVQDLRHALARLRRLGGASTVRLRLARGQRVDELRLPRAVFDQILALLDHAAAGRAVTLVPSEAVIGTQEAAELLGVSRPHLVKLLDAGKIPSRKVGVRRRVRASDVLAYRRAQDELRAEIEATVDALLRSAPSGRGAGRSG
jgi:excisionase family DNA binding protein